MSATLTLHRGGCHCGRVRFEFEAPENLNAVDCNCTICAKCGYLHYFVARSRFRLLAGDDVLTTYRFGTGIAEHLFCSVCGVKSFYIPRSHPDAYSVNMRCVDGDTVRSLSIETFDGCDWEKNAHKLSPISD